MWFPESDYLSLQTLPVQRQFRALHIHWHTTLRDKSEFYWDDPITYEGYPIFYHNRYMRDDGIDINGYGFGDCCGPIYNFED